MDEKEKEELAREISKIISIVLEGFGSQNNCFVKLNGSIDIEEKKGERCGKN